MRPLNITWLILTFLFGISFSVPPLKEHSFKPEILENGSKTVKINGTKVIRNCRKVFMTLIHDGYEFRRRDTNGMRGESGSSYR